MCKWSEQLNCDGSARRTEYVLYFFSHFSSILVSPPGRLHLFTTPTSTLKSPWASNWLLESHRMLSVYFDVVTKNQSFQQTKAPKGTVRNSNHKSLYDTALCLSYATSVLTESLKRGLMRLLHQAAKQHTAAWEAAKGCTATAVMESSTALEFRHSWKSL